MTCPEGPPSSPGGTAALLERLTAVEAGIRNDRHRQPAVVIGEIARLRASGATVTAIAAETGVHASDDDSFSATVKCHDANGELYSVTISRTAVSVSGYTADAILTTIEAWADGVPALA